MPLSSRAPSPPGPPTPTGDSSDRPGVGLLGILVTLAVVALLAGIAIPAWFARHGVTLDKAAILLARDLRATQNRAAFLGAPARFVLDEHGWCAYDADGDALTRLGGPERIERRLDADGVFEGVSLAAIRFGDDATIAFDADGDALESGSVELHFRDQMRSLHLHAPEGRVEIEGLAGGWFDDGH